jgi:hypothetical protein
MPPPLWGGGAHPKSTLKTKTNVLVSNNFSDVNLTDSHQKTPCIICNYTIGELKWDILILRWRGIGNDLKHSTPAGCGFNLHRYKMYHFNPKSYTQFLGHKSYRFTSKKHPTIKTY